MITIAIGTKNLPSDNLKAEVRNLKLEIKKLKLEIRN